jgi:hypothetical protein
MQIKKIFYNLNIFNITYVDERDGEELFKIMNLTQLQRLIIDDGERDLYGDGN